MALLRVYIAEIVPESGRDCTPSASRPVELTRTEYELLRVLSLNAGRVATYESLLRWTP